jgi:hypothetical protein
MSYRLLADAVLLLHLGFIVFAVFGALLAWRWPRVLWFHPLAVLWAAGIEFAGGICPLTPLENRLRIAAGESGYAGGFIEHYLLALIYPDGLTRGHQLVLGALVLLLNLAIYLAWWRRQTQLRGGRKSS